MHSRIHDRTHFLSTNVMIRLFALVGQAHVHCAWPSVGSIFFYRASSIWRKVAARMNCVNFGVGAKSIYVPKWHIHDRHRDLCSFGKHDYDAYNFHFVCFIRLWNALVWSTLFAKWRIALPFIFLVASTFFHAKSFLHLSCCFVHFFRWSKHMHAAIRSNGQSLHVYIYLLMICIYICVFKRTATFRRN